VSGVEPAEYRYDATLGRLELAGFTFGVERVFLRDGLLHVDCLMHVVRGSATLPRQAHGVLYGADGVRVLPYPYRYHDEITARAGDKGPGTLRVLLTVAVDVDTP
jgi:hypothetical protein